MIFCDGSQYTAMSPVIALSGTCPWSPNEICYSTAGSCLAGEPGRASLSRSKSPWGLAILRTAPLSGGLWCFVCKRSHSRTSDRIILTHAFAI